MTESRSTAVLASTDEARARLEQAALGLGLSLVYSGDASKTQALVLRQAGAGVYLIALDAATEAALEALDEVLSAEQTLVLFEDADVLLQREGWDHARWLRHLGVKLGLREDVLPPREGNGEAQAAPADDADADVAADGSADVSADVAAEADAWAEVEAAPVSDRESAFDDAAAEPVDSTEAPTPAATFDDPAADVASVEIGHVDMDSVEIESVDFDSVNIETADTDAPTIAAADEVTESHGSTSTDAGHVDSPFDPVNWDIGGSEVAPAQASDDARDTASHAADEDVAESLEELLARSLPDPAAEQPESTDAFATDGSHADSDSSAADDGGPAFAGGLSLVDPDAEPLPADTANAAGEDGRGGPRIDLDALEDRLSGLSLAPIEEDAAPGSESAADADAPTMVVVHAGIGGPDAVRQLLGALDASFDAPLLICQQLANDRHDRLVLQLQRATSLPVELAVAGERPRAGRVHVLPAGMGLELVSDQGGGSRFAEGEVATLAQLADAVHVVLSGADAALPQQLSPQLATGLRVLAQSPEGCYDSQAASALIAQGVEHALPADLAVALASQLQTRN